MVVGVYSVPNKAGVSIVCLTGKRCLLCASWDTGYLICVSHGRGCLFCAQHGRGVYCVPSGAQEGPKHWTRRAGGVCRLCERTGL